MLIYPHHTVAGLIDLDDRSGRWQPVGDVQGEPILVGLMPLAYRLDYEVRGSFAVEDGRRYCLYWNEEDELVFRTQDERRIVLFRREAHGGLRELLPGAHVTLEPAVHRDGKERSGFNIFRLLGGAGDILVEVGYDAARYAWMYAGNPSFVPDEDLSDWDFFLYVKCELAELRTLARAAAGELPVVASGEPCPQEGNWAACHHLRSRAWPALGEPLPEIEGRPDTWVRLAPRTSC